MAISAGASTADGLLRVLSGAQGLDFPSDFLDRLPIGVYLCDRDGLIVRFNRRAVALWGRAPAIGDPAERYCGSQRMLLPNGALLPHAECPMAGVLKTGTPVRSQEVVIERPDGSRILATVDIDPIRDDAGEIAGAVNCFRDVTDYRRRGDAAHALIVADNARLLNQAHTEIDERRRSEEAAQRLAAIVASSDDAILAKNLDGIIQSWNAGAERLFGYTAEEAMGKPVTMLIPPDRQNEETEILTRIRAGDRVDHYETIRRRKDGSDVEISLSVSPVRDGTGKYRRRVQDRPRHHRAPARRAAAEAPAPGNEPPGEEPVLAGQQRRRLERARGEDAGGDGGRGHRPAAGAGARPRADPAGRVRGRLWRRAARPVCTH